MSDHWYNSHTVDCVCSQGEYWLTVLLKLLSSDMVDRISKFSFEVNVFDKMNKANSLETLLSNCFITLIARK